MSEFQEFTFRGNFKPQWDHPLLHEEYFQHRVTSKAELQAFAYDYYLKFLVFFKNQPEGNLRAGTDIEFSKRMRQRLGEADLFRGRIRLNLNYFQKDPRLLPYTLFHEMTHLWLYHCHLDPGHTRRFYKKMTEFEFTALPFDNGVHIHKRIANDSKFVYICPGCDNRWHVNRIKKAKISCGFCFDTHAQQQFPQLFKNSLGMMEQLSR